MRPDDRMYELGNPKLNSNGFCKKPIVLLTLAVSFLKLVSAIFYFLTK